MPDEVPGFEFEIMDADPRRIKRLKIHRRRADARPPDLRRRPKRTDSVSGESSQDSESTKTKVAASSGNG